MSGTAGIQDLQAGTSLLTDIQGEIVEALNEVDVNLDKLEQAVQADDLSIYSSEYAGTPTTNTVTYTAGSPFADGVTYTIVLDEPLLIGANPPIYAIDGTITNFTDTGNGTFTCLFNGSLCTVTGSTDNGNGTTTYTGEGFSITVPTPPDATTVTTTTYGPGMNASDQAGMFTVSTITDDLTKLSSVLTKADKTKGDIQSAILKQWIA